MPGILIYAAKVAVAMTLFYLFFRLLMGRDNLHRLNRIVLVFTVIVSFILPFCIITIHKTLPGPEPSAFSFREDVYIGSQTATLADTFYLWNALAALYLLGIGIYLAKIAADIFKLKRMIDRSEHVKDAHGITIAIVPEDMAPFSWMNYIFLSRKDYLAGNSHILEHERAHIRMGHAVELLFVECLSSLQWFNPTMWFLKSDLRAIYEYEADEAVLRKGVDMKEYQYSLVKKAASASGYSITNAFNHNILKKRIAMMSTPKASVMKGFKVLYILPLLCGSLALNAKTVVSYEVSEKNAMLQDDAIPFQLVEEQPKFSGEGPKEFAHWVNERLTYPAEAKAAGIQGRVTIRFVIDETGKLTDAKVLRGVNPAIDAEALKIVSSSPEWTPGKHNGQNVKVSYAFPVIFHIND